MVAVVCLDLRFGARAAAGTFGIRLLQLAWPLAMVAGTLHGFAVGAWTFRAGRGVHFQTVAFAQMDRMGRSGLLGGAQPYLLFAVFGCVSSIGFGVSPSAVADRGRARPLLLFAELLSRAASHEVDECGFLSLFALSRAVLTALHTLHLAWMGSDVRFIIFHIAGFSVCGVAKTPLYIVRLLRVLCRIPTGWCSARALALSPRAKADAAGRGCDAPGSLASWAPLSRCPPLCRWLGTHLEAVGTLSACPVLFCANVSTTVVGLGATVAIRPSFGVR